jgi:hypothetical protein
MLRFRNTISQMMRMGWSEAPTPPPTFPQHAALQLFLVEPTVADHAMSKTAKKTVYAQMAQVILRQLPSLPNSADPSLCAGVTRVPLQAGRWAGGIGSL